MIGGFLGGLAGGLLVGCILLPIFYLIGSRRDVGKATANRPADMKGFIVHLPREEAMRAIVAFAERSKLKVESVDAVQGKIVLGANMGLLTFHSGYWLLIYVLEDAQRRSTIEIGIKSKVYQAGFALRVIRDKAFDKMQAALVTNRV
jgi:hypothetical protein